MRYLVIGVLILSAAICLMSVEWTVEWFSAHPEWRASGGEVYNVTKSKRWVRIAGLCVSKTNNLAVIEQRWTEYNKVSGRNERRFRWCAITNATTEIGDEFNDLVIQIKGKLWFREESIEILDFGTTPTADQIMNLKNKVRSK